MKLSAGSKGTVLLLSSEPVVLSVLKDSLENAGYVVLPATNLGSAVQRLYECNVDLLVIRPHIDSMTGHQAALYLRTKSNGLRALIVTGFPFDDRLIYRESLHSIDVFPDPFSNEDFLAKVAAAIATKSQERASAHGWNE